MIRVHAPNPELTGTARPDGATDALVVRDLVVEYAVGRDHNRAVKGISFAVRPGAVVAVVGESGSGKSTLAHAIVRLLPENARVVGGSVHLGATELSQMSERALRAVRGARIGFVPQDPMSSLNPTQTVGRQVAEAVTLHEGRSTDAPERVLDLLTRAGLPDAADVVRKYPHELSGGMRQRVLIAMAFACDPELIIADEPTSALDASVARHVLDNLVAMVHERGATLLVITHDLAVARQRATDVVVMTRGEAVEQGPVKTVFEHPQHEYTRRLLGSSLHLTRTGRPSARTLVPPTGNPLVRVDDVTKVYTGNSRPAVSGVSLDLYSGRTLALVGESGSGKSTTARMVLGLETVTSGGISVFGRDVAGMGRRHRRDLYRRLQVVYQSPFASLDPRFSVGESVAEPLRNYRVGDRAERRDRVAHLLERVGLPADFAARKPAQLSGGQRQRVAIARALAVSPDVVVCDEAVSALDASVQAQVLDLLRQIQEESGVAYLFITHDLAVVADMAHDVVVMRAGRVVESGSAHDVLTTPSSDYTAQLLAAAFDTDHPTDQTGQPRAAG